MYFLTSHTTYFLLSGHYIKPAPNDLSLNPTEKLLFKKIAMNTETQDLSKCREKEIWISVLHPLFLRHVIIVEKGTERFLRARCAG